MKRRNLITRLVTTLAIVFSFVFFTPNPALAHCDTMDGPVVKAAQKALQAKNVNLVLIWVQENDEAVIRKAFHETLAVRTLNHAARDLADRWFFETLVRLHRAGEGEPFTGIEPAGTDLGPVIRGGDQAIQTGVIEPLLSLFPTDASAEIQTRFKDVVAKKSYHENDVVSGRKFVKAYVSFLHYLEHVGKEKEHK